MDDADLADYLATCNESPDGLLNICTNYVINNMECYWRREKQSFKLRDEDFVIPREVCEKLLESLQQRQKTGNLFISIFSDKEKSKLKSVSIQNSNVTDEGLFMLLQHDLHELRLKSKCNYLTFDSFREIFNNCSKMIILEIDVMFLTDNNKDEQLLLWSKKQAPLLRKLRLNLQLIAGPNEFLQCFPSLTHLDLSECVLVGNISSVSNLSLLRVLILYNVQELSDDTIEWMFTLKNLEHLDISHDDETHGQFDNPNEILSRIVASLPNLRALDISGTNLAGNGVADRQNPDVPKCDIVGLAARVDNPLEFLGLYGVSHAAASRHDIPAIKVTGDATPEQIMVAATAYIDREGIFIKVLNDLFHMCRSEKEHKDKFNRVVLIVLEGMRRHNVRQVQILGSAILFYVVKGNQFGNRLKKQIIVAIIDAMRKNVSELTMMRNGCLTLLNFNIPSDVLFKYKELASILLHCISSDRTSEGLVQRLAISLLNSMACQVDEVQKVELGKCGIVTKMVNIISERLRRNVCDEVLQVAWSTLWNITDETPSNCDRFIKQDGLELFRECLNTFPNQDELLRNMMGLLGNIAEVKQLRYVFMTEGFLTVFAHLLDSEKDGIEISYNAAGVIAHIASDGLDSWTINDPPYQAVLTRVSVAIQRWDINKERNIHYRSFGPILRLISPTYHPVCSHWAIWALANLTTVYPKKYCKLLLSEQGIPLLEDSITWDFNSYPSVEGLKSLARLTINNCLIYKESLDSGECSSS